MRIYSKLAAIAAATCVALGVAGAGTAAAAEPPDWLQCVNQNVPVSGAPAGTPAWTIYGELCQRRDSHPKTVQLLVHGATYTHSYWDFPVDPARHSYVRAAAAAGYATFNVDRLGVGSSTRPPSELVHLNTVVDTLSEVIGHLRAGDVGGASFSRVVWVGHSYGSEIAWVEASRHHDVDAFVITGLLHQTKSSTVPQYEFVPAAVDNPQRWGALDPGYLSMRDASRGLFYYGPTTDPAVVARDNELKDTVTTTEAAEALPLALNPDPATAPSRDIHVPTLLLLGDHDATACGAPDGLDCTVANVRAAEAPFYPSDAHLAVGVVPDTGHDLTLHQTSPLSAVASLTWLGSVAPPN
jgi:pimeloyl-ACP methyl ester carboxylesterase